VIQYNKAEVEMAKRLNKTSLTEALCIFDFPAGCEITKKIIMQKYRELAIVNHPDKGGDTKKFAKIAEAKEVLIREFESIKNESNSNGKINPKFDSTFVDSIMNDMKTKKSPFTTYFN